jgi:hypothetical protein
MHDIAQNTNNVRLSTVFLHSAFANSTNLTTEFVLATRETGCIYLWIRVFLIRKWVAVSDKGLVEVQTILSLSFCCKESESHCLLFIAVGSPSPVVVDTLLFFHFVHTGEPLGSNTHPSTLRLSSHIEGILSWKERDPRKCGILYESRPSL